MENKLMKCPCCDGEAEYKTGNHYISMCHYIRCKNCHLQTGAVDEGKYLQFGGKKDVVFTAETARQYVIDVWNRRTLSPDNCTNAECPYQSGTPCPASDGCGGFIPGNNPLTVEELREMDGEPVWVKSGRRVFACIVQKRQMPNNDVFAHGFHDYDGIRLVHDVTFTFMASDVDCYRCKPEKGE